MLSPVDNTHTCTYYWFTVIKSDLDIMFLVHMQLEQVKSKLRVCKGIYVQKKKMNVQLL